MGMLKLKIALIADPEIPVPPRFYGGIERIVAMLAVGLTDRGHDVHLFSSPESSLEVHRVAFRGLSSGNPVDILKNSFELNRLARAIKVDVVHSFGRLAYLLPLSRSGIPLVQSYQRQVTPRSVRLGRFLFGKSLTFTACSHYCAGSSETRSIFKVIYNGVPMDKYRFVSDVPEDAPLIFIGRLERIKGAHTAIAVAKKAGRRLIIAGNHADTGEHRRYFDEEILPYCDGERICYVGPVDDVQKNELLGSAAAMLFPIEWEEPFGIVMVEALACGTPVIAFSRGAAPEVLENGKSGFLCHTVNEMADAVLRINSLSRLECYRAAEMRFSNRVIVDQYEKLYGSLVERKPCV